MQKFGSEPLEATWSGFEVEVENDNGEISTSQIDLTNETAECVVHDEPEIIVQVLEEPVNNGDAVHGLKTAGNNSGISNNHISTSALKKDNRLFDSEKSFRQPSLKRPRLLNERSLEKVTDFKFEQRQKTPGTPLIEVKDEYAAFAIYVQQELKKISNPYGLQMAKLKINQVLFEGTTGSYDKIPSTNSAVKTPNRSQMIITSKIQPFETPQQRVVSGNSDVS